MIKSFLTKLFFIILAAVILTDLVFSFYQYYQFTTDGDMPESLIISESYKNLFSSPFGFKSISESIDYPNPNRFFGHWTFRQVFTNGVWAFQNLTYPIKSVFLTIATANIIFHIAILLLISMAVTGSRNIFKHENLLAMVLVFPLFQANGFWNTMGIIMKSITYNFFYALPSIYFLWVLLPFSFKYLHDKNYFKNPISFLLYVPIAIIANFSGALNQGGFLIFTLIFYLYYFWQNFINQKDITFISRIANSIFFKNSYFWLLLLPLSAISLYSFYVGTHNSNNAIYPYSLFELYMNIPKGLKLQFFSQYDYAPIFFLLIVNYFIIKSINKEKGKRILKTYWFLLIFSLIFILLLPLGGYRDYRPYILRSDSVILINLGIYFLFALTTLFVFKNWSSLKLKFYIPVIALVLFYFEFSDPYNLGTNKCERNNMQQIADSKEDVVKLSNQCPVISWTPIVNPEHSIIQAKVLKLWRITDREKLFFQPIENAD